MKHLTALPKPPVGSSREAQFMRQLLKCLEERTLLYADGAEVSYQTNGTAIKNKPKRGTGGGGGTAEPVWLP